jgi:hypothetical protein
MSLMTALGLIMSVLPAQSASVTISSLPFNITVPGTYVLASDLAGSAPGTAITVNCSAAGAVVLDLGGHTLSHYAPGGIGNLDVGILIAASPSASSITIRNGTLYNFWEGIAVNTNGYIAGQPPVTTTPIYNVHIKSISFTYERLTSVWFDYANSSCVNDCTFIGRSGFAQIKDDNSQTGNQYNDNAFQDSSTALEITPPSIGTWILDRCQFEPVTN